MQVYFSAACGEVFFSGKTISCSRRKESAFKGGSVVELALFEREADNPGVSSRETVIEFARNLPEEMSLAEIAREVELLAGVQTAREQAHRGEGIPAEGARKLVDTWASK
jgi:hypothetical protein